MGMIILCMGRIWEEVLQGDTILSSVEAIIFSFNNVHYSKHWMNPPTTGTTDIWNNMQIQLPHRDWEIGPIRPCPLTKIANFFYLHYAWEKLLLDCLQKITFSVSPPLPPHTHSRQILKNEKLLRDIQKKYVLFTECVKTTLSPN